METKIIKGVDVTVIRLSPEPIPFGWNPLDKMDKGKVTTHSYSNYDQSVVLSGLIKNLNRGFNVEALKWGLEMFYTNRAVRTWSWNILLEYSLDAIGPADPTAFLRVKYLQTNYHEKVEAFITAILILTQARKTNTILFSGLIYPELKVDGVADKLNMSPEQLLQKLNESLQTKNLSNVIYAIYALAKTQRTPQFKHQDSTERLAMVHEAFMGIQNPNQPSYVFSLLKAATDDNWKWKDRSLKIYLHLAHLHCTDNLPSIASITQLPADNVIFLAKLFIERNGRMLMFGEGPYGPSQFQMDLSTGWGKKLKTSKENYVENISVLDNEDPSWKPLSDFYRASFLGNKTKKIR